MNKSYEGKMMIDGKANEEIILKWLKSFYEKVIDVRDIKKFQDADIDFIVLKDNRKITIETKSDKWIDEKRNLLFEFMRIRNSGTWFYLGWGYRSKAELLIIRNPETNIIFLFNFEVLRKAVSDYIKRKQKETKIEIIKTDDFETTFGFLIPMEEIRTVYNKFIWTQ